MCQEKQQLALVEVESNDSSLVLNNGLLLYINKPFTGLFKEYDSINNTTNSSNYILGKKGGLETKTYTNQIIAEERFYKRGLKTGNHRGFWQDGSLKFEYFFNNKGFYDGSFKQWSKDGQIIKEFNYVNGKENGSQKMWNTNGTIRANYFVKHGEIFGLIGLKKCYSIAVQK